jgi:hypothetical protein
MGVIKMTVREEISKTLGKFFIEYSVRNHNSNWNHSDKIIKQEDIKTILQECYNLEDEYADKIISKIEKRIENCTTIKEVKELLNS